MSDHDHDHDHGHDEGGGHEIDKMPSSKLFNLLFGLSALTLIACIGVVQLFNSQVSTMRGVRDAKVPFQLAEYRQSMGELENRWGMVLLPDDDGVPVKEGGQSVHESQRYFMPVAEARKRVLESPGQYFKATRPYPRWPNPDPNAPAAIRPGARGPSVRPAPPTGGRPMRVPGQPGAQPGQPGAQPGQPGAQPGQPGAQPSAVPAQPRVVPVQPRTVPAAGQPAEGQPAEGKPAEGKAAEGKPAEGKAAEGKAGQ